MRRERPRRRDRQGTREKHVARGKGSCDARPASRCCSTPSSHLPEHGTLAGRSRHLYEGVPRAAARIITESGW